jgi:AraC-like DNA-binding protein
MDALSDVLRAAQLSGGVFLHAEFSAPWCLAARMSPGLCAPFLGPASHLIPFHYVVEGELRVAVEHGDPIRLHANEIVLFPHNDAHLMGSDLRLVPAMAGELIRPGEGGGLSSIEYGGGGAPTRVICGYLGCDAGPSSPVLAGLPDAMVLEVARVGPADWIRSTFQFAADEIAAGRVGSETVLAKISELLFVQAVRSYVEALPEGRSGWLAGLRDPVVARALALIHRDIARPWTVDELARESGTSRSVLAERFNRTIGAAPMHYLAQWRMQLAAQELKASGATLVQIAERVGYESDAAFSRAFKKKFGMAPASWKRASEARERDGGAA